MALDDLADHLTARWPGVEPVVTIAEPGRRRDDRRRATRRRRAFEASDRRAAEARNEAARPPRGSGLLEAILLGVAYPLGLVRAAEEPERAASRAAQPAGPIRPGGRPHAAAPPGLRTVPVRPAELRSHRLSPGADAPARGPAQPVRLVDADRRRDSSCKLTRESIVRGLDRGLKPEWMLETLTRHSQRPLPAGVIEAIKTWAARRERVTYYAATTLIEFGIADERDQALELWPRDARGSDRRSPSPTGSCWSRTSGRSRSTGSA